MGVTQKHLARRAVPIRSSTVSLYNAVALLATRIDRRRREQTRWSGPASDSLSPCPALRPLNTGLNPIPASLSHRPALRPLNTGLNPIPASLSHRPALRPLNNGLNHIPASLSHRPALALPPNELDSNYRSAVGLVSSDTYLKTIWYINK